MQRKPDERKATALDLGLARDDRSVRLERVIADLAWKVVRDSLINDEHGGVARLTSGGVPSTTQDLVKRMVEIQAGFRLQGVHGRAIGARLAGHDLEVFLAAFVLEPAREVLAQIERGAQVGPGSPQEPFARGSDRGDDDLDLLALTAGDAGIFGGPYATHIPAEELDAASAAQAKPQRPEITARVLRGVEAALGQFDVPHTRNDAYHLTGRLEELAQLCVCRDDNAPDATGERDRVGRVRRAMSRLRTGAKR